MEADNNTSRVKQNVSSEEAWRLVWSIVQYYKKSNYRPPFLQSLQPEDQEDVIHDSTLVMHERIRSGNFIHRHLPASKQYFIKLMRTEARKYYKKPTSSDLPSIEALIDPRQTRTENRLDTEEMRSRIVKAVLSLEKKERDIILCHYVMRMSFVKTAQYLELSTKSVYCHHNKALRILKKILMQNAYKIRETNHA